jgi:type II secretory pathway pseudopilin PulG
MRSQGGYTLVEVVIASALGMVVMTALTSVILTSWRAGNTAVGRVEASSEIRNFQFRAYDDFAQSGLPVSSGCGAAGCSTPIVLTGPQVGDSVTYSWDSKKFLDRTRTCLPPNGCQAGGSSRHVATDVTYFSWYLDGRTVVVRLTVTVLDYSETQTMRFYPRVAT